jgi:hypothetical protein
VERPEAFLHVIDCKHIGDASKSMQQTVFEAKARRWSDDGGFREQCPCDLLALCLSYLSMGVYADREF